MIQPKTAIIISTLVLVVLLRGLRRYFVLFWLAALPGILFHELSHWLLAFVSNGRPCFPRMLPKRVPGGYVLARVPVRNPTWYNGAFIGLAPLLLIAMAFVAIVYGSPESWSWAQAWRIVLIPVVAAECLVECAPSPADWRIARKTLWPVVAAVVCVMVFREFW